MYIHVAHSESQFLVDMSQRFRQFYEMISSSWAPAILETIILRSVEIGWYMYIMHVYVR